MIEFIAKYWLEVAFGVIVCAMSAGFRITTKKIKERKTEQDAIKDGVLALLHDRLYQGGTYFIRQEEISTAEMKNIEYLYRGYHALGGNGTGTELYERVKELKLKEEQNGKTKN